MTIRFVARTGLSVVGAITLAAAVQGFGASGAVAAPASTHVSGTPLHAVVTPNDTVGRFSGAEKARPALTLPKTTARTGSWEHLTAAEERSGTALGRRVERAIRTGAWRSGSRLSHIMTPGHLVEAIPDFDAEGVAFGTTENRVSCEGGELRVLSVGDPGWNGGEGAAWVFILNGGSEIEEAFEFTDPAATAGDAFGASVGFSCDFDAAFFGAPGTDGGAGVVYAGEPGTTTPATPDANEVGGFGSSLAASANEPFIIVGSPEAPNGGNVAIIADERRGSEDLPDPNATAGDQFGSAIALSTRHLALIVGSPGDQTAWIYNNNSESTSPQGKMSGACDAPNFGQSVAISANGLVAVASGSDPTTTVTDSSGCAEIDQFGDGYWSYIQTLSSENANPVAGDDFGASVATNSNGSKIAIGEPGRADPSDTNSGDVQLFSYTADGWSIATQYTTPAATGGTPPVSQFGASVTLQGFRIAVGAPGTIDGSGFGNGAAFIFATNFVAEPPVFLGGCIVRAHAQGVTPHC